MVKNYQKGGEKKLTDTEWEIPYGQSRLVKINPEHALEMAEVLELGAKNIGGLMVDRGTGGVNLANRITNTELSAEGTVAVHLDQMDLNAVRGILGLMRAAQELRVEPDVEVGERILAAETIFDNMRGQISGVVFSS